MTSNDTITIPAPVLRDFLTRIFKAVGCDAETARHCSEGVIDADLHGHHLQGTDHIYSTVRELKAGRLNGRPKVTITHETAATARVNGDGGPGHATGTFATELAIRKAKASGMAAVALVGGGDIFRLGFYVEKIARAGMTGMVFTNTHPVRVHPAGGIDPLLGTNPVAFAFPVTGKEPIVVDLATSTSAIGHVRIANYSGAAIPPGIAIDRNGAPTTSAQEALDGALTPLGGHKGFGLGLAIGLLSGPVIGAVIGSELQNALAASEGERRRGHMFVAIDPAAFGDAHASSERTARYAAELKRSRKAAGVEEILIPGERGQRKRARYEKDGIPLDRAIWDNTVRIAAEAGVTPPAL
jgi:LDH2 family malate/lactate/ureidoglycolate dehydrogenase